MKPQFNVIASERYVFAQDFITAIPETFDRNTANRPNLLILGGDLASAGAELLKQAIDIKSLHLAQIYAGGACVPFGAGGHFSPAFSAIARDLPTDFINYFYSPYNDSCRPFETERWSEYNQNYQAVLIPYDDTLTRFRRFLWNSLKYHIAGKSNIHTTLRDADLNYCATPEGEQHCLQILRVYADGLQYAAQTNARLSALHQLLMDNSQHAFVRLFQASLFTRELLNTENLDIQVEHQLLGLKQIFTMESVLDGCAYGKIFFNIHLEQAKERIETRRYQLVLKTLFTAVGISTLIGIGYGFMAYGFAMKLSTMALAFCSLRLISSSGASYLFRRLTPRGGHSEPLVAPRRDAPDAKEAVLEAHREMRFNQDRKSPASEAQASVDSSLTPLTNRRRTTRYGN
jgi:hypothetical protein